MAYLNYVIYEASPGEWRWRLETVNGRIIADGAESYVSKQHCLDAIDLVKGSGPAPVKLQAA